MKLLFPNTFNIFFCCIVIIEDILRLIPESLGVDESAPEDKANFVCVFQAVTSGFFDKLLLSNMTIYSIITSLGVFFSEFYKNHLKKIFLITISIGFLMSLALTIAYETEGIAFKDIVKDAAAPQVKYISLGSSFNPYL